jgi:hypothetical protein
VRMVERRHHRYRGWDAGGANVGRVRLLSAALWACGPLCAEDGYIRLCASSSRCSSSSSPHSCYSKSIAVPRSPGIAAPCPPIFLHVSIDLSRHLLTTTSFAIEKPRSLESRIDIAADAYATYAAVILLSCCYSRPKEGEMSSRAGDWWRRRYASPGIIANRIVVKPYEIHQHNAALKRLTFRKVSGA